METAKFDQGLKEDRNLDWGDSEFYHREEVILDSNLLKRIVVIPYAGEFVRAGFSAVSSHTADHKDFISLCCLW